MEGFTPFIETFEVLKRSVKAILVLFFLTFGNSGDEGIDIVRDSWLEDPLLKLAVSLKLLMVNF